MQKINPKVFHNPHRVMDNVDRVTAHLCRKYRKNNRFLHRRTLRLLRTYTNVPYVFDDNTTKVGFSGDCTYTETLDKFVKYCDVLFLECCDMKTDTRHLGYDKFIEYVKLYKDKKFYGIHCTNKIYFAENKLGITLAHSQDTYTF